MDSLSWQAPNFHYYEKSSSWYVWSIVVTAIVVLFALVQGNILFVFFAIVAEALILTLGKQKPRLMTYEATDTRIIVDGFREYPYVELEGFAVVDDPFSERYCELVMSPKKRLGTYIKILVPNERGTELRQHLGQYVGEIAYEESVSDSILKRIGL